MLHEVVKAKCGILFDDEGLDDLMIPIDCVPRTNPPDPEGGHRSEGSDDSQDTLTGENQANIKVEEYLTTKTADRVDSNARVYDRMKSNPFWWLVQLPVWNGSKYDLPSVCLLTRY